VPYAVIIVDIILLVVAGGVLLWTYKKIKDIEDRHDREERRAQWLRTLRDDPVIFDDKPTKGRMTCQPNRDLQSKSFLTR
jgi:hypothetical protein